jgi:hypothetical protein
MDVNWISSEHEEKAWGINTYTSGVYTFLGPNEFFVERWEIGVHWRKRRLSGERDLVSRTQSL